jgi:hypothetical protein
MKPNLLDQQLLSAFGQGEAESYKGGYRSNNPHTEPLRREAWIAGFEWEEGPKYILAKRQESC